MIEQDIYKKGKLFNKLDLEIMMKKADIRNLQMSIEKAFKMAGMDGPKNNLTMDYSRIQTGTHKERISIDEALRLADRDKQKINQLKKEIAEIRAMKNNLIKLLQSVDGIEEQIFYHRVIMNETQERVAQIIGLSTRHLQRLEKKMRLIISVCEDL